MARPTSNSPYRFYMRQLSTKLARGKKLGAFKRDEAMSDEAVTLDYIMEKSSSPAASTASPTRSSRSTRRRAASAPCSIAARTGPTPRWGRHSMELMAEKVMPAVNAALGPARAAE